MPVVEAELILPIALILFIAFLIAIANATLFKRKMTKRRSRLLIPGYQLFYTDKKGGNRKEGVFYSTLLFDEEFDIAGKPDYIFKKVLGSDLIPVELKSGTIGTLRMPRQNDLMQLCAYFVIIESYFGIRPKTGRLVYSDYMFIIKNTKHLQNELIEILDDMRRMMRTGKHTVNPSFVLCRYCACRGSVCEHCDS